MGRHDIFKWFEITQGHKKEFYNNNKMSNSTTELFTEGNFSYHVLTPAHKVKSYFKFRESCKSFLKDAAHAVLARAFCSEPACSDVAEVGL